ncbi:transglutaminase domain-containing protein [Candidatus Daviesbacteria bacterium]|nr:transglutaminase domain-containing protein [Candidatus Daviesbacteria bacterium]
MEIEVLPTREASTHQVTLNQVWQEFRRFEVRVQQGFFTEEERLGAYIGLIGVASDFFSDTEVKRSDNPRLKELVNALFYQHENYATVPIDFFVEATKRIKQEVLDEGVVRPLGNRFRDEVDFIGKLIQQELLAATTAAKSERDDKRSLESLASNALANESISPIEANLSITQARQRIIKQAIVDQLAKNEELGKDIERRDAYLAAIRQLQSTTPTQEAVHQLLNPFEDFLQRQPDNVSNLDDLYLHIATGHSSYVAISLNELLQAGEDPDFIWRQWVEQGVIPAGFYESFEQISTLAELSEAAQLLSGLPKEVKAKSYLPYLEKGVSASLLRQMTEGNFDLPDDLITQQVAAFLDLYSAHERGEEAKKGKGWSTKRKLITALVVATVVAMPFIYKGYMSPDTASGISIEDILESIPQDELAGLKHLGEEEGVTVTIEGGGISGGGIAGSEQGVPSTKSSAETRTSPQEPGYTVSSDFIKPENNSPEALMEAQKKVLWNLQGEDLLGFYRISSSSSFDPNRKGWMVNRNYVQGSQAVFTNRKDIILSAQVRVGRQLIELPTRGNYPPTINGVKVEGISGGFGVYQTTDGSYFLNFSKEEIGKTVTISYSLGKIEGSIIPKPTDRELQEMRKKYIEIDDLPPGELKTLMQQLRDNKNLSPAVKAKVIEKYIQNNFLYSLDAKWSDDYHSQRGVKDFFRRITELKRTDCDVANSALVMLLRAQNIPSRMVFGAAHTGGFLTSGKDKITGAEMHGWSEAYIGGQWLSLDATPFNQDSYTQKALAGKTSPSQLKQIREREEFIRQATSLQNWLEKDMLDIPGFNMALLLKITGLNMAALATSILLRRRNNRAAGKLRKEVEARTEVYLGSSYPTIGDIFARRERVKIDQIKTDGVNPMTVIPPFGFFGLGGDVIRTLVSNRIPYHAEAPTITRPTEPNTLEYLTKVLGYKEKDVRRRLYIEAYDVARSHIADQIDTLVYNFTKDGITTYNFAHHIRKSIEKLAEPGDTEAWEATKSALNERLYQHYATVRARGERKEMREAAKYAGEPRISPRMSKEEFEKRMDELYRLRLVQWVTESGYVNALQSLGNKT